MTYFLNLCNKTANISLDALVLWVKIWKVSMNLKQFTSSQFCMTLQRREMGSFLGSNIVIFHF